MAEHLGKYKIDGFIAEGGMARILRAKTVGVGGVEKTVALKCLKGVMSKDDSYVQMLLDEARITVNMTHKNICQVYGLENDGNTYFMVMELIDGINLSELCRYLFSINRVFPVEAAVFIAMEVCSGLSYAHRMLDENGENLGIVHRDVNPQNICISKEGEVKLIDFGIAKAQKSMFETQAGTIKGKFNYMSPEQARGERVDQRTDVFALGAVLYEMLSGHMLYPQSLDDARLRTKTRMADFVPIETYVPDIPEKLRRILAKALTRDITQRFESSRDFLLALTQFFHDSCKVYDAINLSMLVEKYLSSKDKRPAERQPAEKPYFDADDSKTTMISAPAISSGKGGAASVEARNIDVDDSFSLESGDTAVINAMEARRIARGEDVDDTSTSVYSKADFDAAVKSSLKEGSPFDSISSAAVDRSINLDIKDAKAETTIMVKVDSVKPKSQGNLWDKISQRILSMDERTLIILALVLATVLTLAIILFLTLGGSKEESAHTVSSVAQIHQIQISTNPPNAEIYIDGKKSDYRPPCTIPGNLTIEVKAPWYTPRLVFLSEIQEPSYNVVLDQVVGIIELNSTPQGADIKINDVDDIKTPMQKAVDIKNTYRIEFSKPGYHSEYVEVSWSASEAETSPKKDIDVRLKKISD